jgi:hypothetical protein
MNRSQIQVYKEISTLWRHHVEGAINLDEKKILKNIRCNIRRPLPQLWGHVLMLLCGGPSLSDHEKEIVKQRRNGWKICTVNGTLDWCRDHDVTPGVHIQLDARAWNKRFVQAPIDGCRYLISSQSDPSVFEALKDHDVTIWHGGGGFRRPTLERYYRGRWMPNLAGSTVGTHAITILYLLGFRKIVIYGMDSCLRSRTIHHAYKQPENDRELIFKLRVGRRIFYAHAWMVQQLDDLLGMLPLLADDLNLDFKGDNLVRHVIRYASAKGRPPKITIIDKV